MRPTAERSQRRGGSFALPASVPQGSEQVFASQARDLTDSVGQFLDRLGLESSDLLSQVVAGALHLEPVRTRSLSGKVGGPETDRLL